MRELVVRVVRSGRVTLVRRSRAHSGRGEGGAGVERGGTRQEASAGRAAVETRVVGVLEEEGRVAV